MSLTSIVDTSIKVPRAFVKVSLGVGVRSAGSAPIKVLLVGNKTTAGTATLDRAVQVTSENDAKTLFGAGSELAIACTKALRANKYLTLYAMPITTGGATVPSSVLTVTGPATSAGNVFVDVAGERVAVAITSGMTAAQAVTAIVAAINAKSDWPVTAADGVGDTVDISARAGWVRGSHISLRTSTTATGLTVSMSGTGYLGSTPGNLTDDPTAGLAAVAPDRFHIIAHGYQASADCTKFKTHVATYADPTEGRRQVWLGTFIGTYANGKTLSDTENDKRGILCWYEDPDDVALWCSAVVAARLAAVWGSDRAFNTDGMVLTGLKLQYDTADVPTGAEQNTALSNGLTPLLGPAGGSEVKLVRAVTNYHLDGSSNPDYSVIDAHYVQVADYVADDLETNFTTAFEGFKLGVDGADGAPPGPRVATTSIVRDFIARRLRLLDNVLLENVADLEASIIVERDTAAAGRVNAEVPIDVIELLHQVAIDVRQTA